MAEEQIVFAFYDGTVISFERGYEHSLSFFGGPMERKVSGIAHGPKPLHLIARLASTHLRAPRRRESDRDGLIDIPLIYGMCYDGCNIEYSVDRIDNIELRDMSPTRSRDDWPYPNFPTLLPYMPLRVGKTRRCSYVEFAQQFPNKPRQQQTEVVITVPPPATIGVSLWGRADADEVTLLFECSLADRMVLASNICS
jgi:hypothetical protein